MKARILTTDYNLAQRAQFHGVAWLNINSLAKALHQVVQAGEVMQVDLIKAGRESGQAVGFLSDGSMVVVDGGAPSIGKTVMVEVASVVPSAGRQDGFRAAGGAEVDAPGPFWGADTGWLCFTLTPECIPDGASPRIR